MLLQGIETKIQQVAFLVQEGIISGLYIFYAHRMLKPNRNVRERRVVWDLIFVSAFVIFLDIVIIVLAFTNLLVIKYVPKHAPIECATVTWSRLCLPRSFTRPGFEAPS